MEYPPTFSFIDVVWAPARALSAKQIAAMTLALLGAMVVYDCFTYVAFAVQGNGLSIVFSAYGLFLFEPSALHGFPAQAIFWCGVALAVLILMMGFVAVAAINIESMRGNRFFSLRQAVRFATSRVGQVARAELAIVALVLFIVLLYFLLGLLTRVPYVGEWLFALFFVIPNFIVALLTVFAIFVALLSVLLLPAVAAAERQGEAFAAILETFSTIIRLPLRWGYYTLFTLVAAKLCSFVYAYFCYRAMQFMIWASSLGAGDKAQQLVRSGLANLPVRSDFVTQVTNVFPGIRWGFSVPTGSMTGADSPVAYVMALMLLIVFATVLGYGLAILAAGQARIYVVLRYLKDGYRIPDEESMVAKAGSAEAAAPLEGSPS
jgi:hypothetical protein